DLAGHEICRWKDYNHKEVRYSTKTANALREHEKIYPYHPCCQSSDKAKRCLIGQKISDFTHLSGNSSFFIHASELLECNHLNRTSHETITITFNLYFDVLVITNEEFEQ